MNTELTKQLNLSLLILRLGVFAVIAIWAVDKFVNPAHTAGVFKAFYSVENLGANVSYAMGVVQGLIAIAFLVGFKRTISYGLVLIIHGASTLISYERYLDPWTGANLLFYAAWPMLAAALVLFILRAHDGWTVDGPTR